MLARLHRDELGGLLGQRFAEHHLERDKPVAITRRLLGFIDGVTPHTLVGALNAIDRHAADTVWLDGSNLGRLALALRRERPTLRILTFFHNVEARFFLGALRRKPYPRAAGVLVANFAAERCAVRNSDSIIALSPRDSNALRRLYGRPADNLLPIAVADPDGATTLLSRRVADDAPLLFVGSAFYANLAGVVWFAHSVAPRVSLCVQVVGHGMDRLRDELASVATVSIVGAVDQLAPYYHAARVAIAPIFDGSGMKTKVAEALMFGKRVIGTSEAFSGYEDVAADAGWQCETPDNFVEAIKVAQSMAIESFDPALRALYEQRYSPRAIRRELVGILA